MEELISQLRQHARGIWQFRWTAVGLAWVVAVAGWLAVFASPTSVESRARVHVAPHGLLKPLLAGMATMPDGEQQLSLLSRTLVSRTNAERALRMAAPDILPGSARHQQAVDDLMDNIKVSGTAASSIYAISYRHADPATARAVVQAMLALFVAGDAKRTASDAGPAIRFLDTQITAHEARLAAADATLHAFRLAHGTLLERGSSYSERLVAADEALQAARLALREAEHARAAIAVSLVGRQGVQDEQAAALATARQQLAALRLRYTERHPDTIAARRLVDDLAQRQGNGGRQASASPPLPVALGEAAARVAAIRVRVAALAARHGQLLGHGPAMLAAEAKLAHHERERDAAREQLGKLASRREAAHLSGQLGASTDMLRFTVIDPPSLPAVASGAARRLPLTVVLLGALCAGAAVALLRSQARPAFAGPGALRQATGIPLLGTVAMHDTAINRLHRRRARILLGMALTSLFVLYTGLLAA